MITTGHCVYTGARVLFTEYGFVTSADLHAVGDCVVINFNASKREGDAREYDRTAAAGATHTVSLGMTGFCREAKGVAVVHRDLIKGPVHHDLIKGPMR